MGYLKRGCAMLLASTMVLGLLPGMSAKAKNAAETAENAADAPVNGFDAYRAPFLSGPIQTWVYQGEEFDYENSKNQIFADDQEDGDLTKNIIQKGSVDTSVVGDQTVTYEVTDSDGHKSTLETTVTVLAKGSEDEVAKNMKRTLYTLPDASHLADVGFNRGYNHDKQNLGFWLPADETLKIRLVNHRDFSADLTLKLLNNDSHTETLAKVTESGTGDATGSVNLPKDGSWITVKNWSGNETDGWHSVDSVPFIITPKRTPVQPIIEIEWNDAFQSIPYYRYGDDEESFFASWDKTGDPYAIIEGDAATFLVPLKDRNNIIDHRGADSVYSFHTVDDMLDWYAAFVKQYDAYSGLDFYTDKPYSQNVRAKFFIKANKHGAGSAYYGGEESATNGDSMDAYLSKEWTSLHEFGHGYEGAIAYQENSFIETTNNILGYYFEMTYRPPTDFGWLLGGQGSTYLEAYNGLGRDSETIRNGVSTFNDMTEGAKEYKKTLFMFINLLDRIGPKEGASAMHTDVRKYHYEHGEDRRSSDTLVDVFANSCGYNLIPYFDGWHIHPSEILGDQVYNSDLPMLYYLRNLVPNDAEAETARQQLEAGGLTMNGIYSLVSTDDMAKLGYTSNVTLKLKMDDLTQIQGKKIRIKNGEKVAKEITVEAGTTDYEISIPVGIYEVELPRPRTASYQYNNEYLVASKTAAGASVEKELVYTKVAGNPLIDDVQVRLLGMSNCEVFAFTLITGDNGQHKLNYRLNNVEPHIYFPDAHYITVQVKDPQGNSIWEKSVQGTGKPAAVNETCDFPIGSKIVVNHEEIGRMRFTSRYTNKVISDYTAGGQNPVTLVMTDKGLKLEGWNNEKLDSAYYSMMTSYSDYLMDNMSANDLEVESSFHNAKMMLSRAYDFLSDEEQEEYDKAYGQLIGHEQTVYGYEKIDPAILTGTADSHENGQEAKYALDESDNNAWHTSYGGYCIRDNQNTYTITLAEPKNVGRLEYVPKDGENGRILTYKLAYSATETGNNFVEITSTLPEWGNNGDKKSVEFDAPQARRIRITALTTAGSSEDNKNRFMSAKHFWLYEKYEVKTAASYLSDMELGLGGSVTKDKANKTVSLPGGSGFVADLTGKEFDTFTAKVSFAGSAAGSSFKVYDGEGDGAKLLYQFEGTAEDTEETFSVGIAGIRKLKFETSNGAQVTLSNARFGNQEQKENIFLVKGDQATIAANASLEVSENGRTKWSSENQTVATVDEYGVITAAAAGETTITAQVSGKSVTCSVYVKDSLEDIIQAVKAVKTAKKQELGAYKEAGNYNAAGKAERTAAINTGCEAIDAAMNLSGIFAALNAAKDKLDAIATGMDVIAEELRQKKEEAKQELTDYKNSADYRKEQRQELKRAIAEGWLAISKEATKDDVDEALAAAKEALDAIQTDWQMTREELRAALADVQRRIADLEESDYTPAAWQRLQTELAEAQAVLENADAGILELKEAKRELLAAVDGLLKPQAVKAAETALQELIDDYASLKQDDYQAASWTEYQQALTDAKTYLTGGENEQYQNAAPIVAAKEALQAAKEAMVPKLNVMEGDWTKGLKSSNSGMRVENGMLVLTGAGGAIDPATYVSAATFDFTRDGSFEFDLQYTSGSLAKFGVYLDYKEVNNVARGMFMGFDYQGWFWQRYDGGQNEWYQGSRKGVPGVNNKVHIKMTWTAAGKYCLYINGDKAFEETNGISPYSAEGKIAFACIDGVTAELGDIRPVKTRMHRSSPESVEAITAKDALQMELLFRSVEDAKADITWSSSDEEVAYVDRAGNIWFVGTGEAVISATAVFSDGSEETASMTVSLPERINGRKLDNAKNDVVVKGAWANTQESIASNKTDGPADWVIDGTEANKWHSQYNGSRFTVSEDNPAKLAIQFAYDLSICNEIKFLQTNSANGQIQKYQIVVGDQYDETTHEIVDCKTSGIRRTEADVVENPVAENRWVTLELPESSDADGRLGRYMQIRVLRGNNGYACIMEFTASFQKEIKNNTAEQGYMTANGQLVAAIKALDGKIADAKAAERKNYTDANWEALQQAVAQAEKALGSGADKDSLTEKKAALEAALGNTEAQPRLAVTFDWNFDGAGADARYVAPGGTVTALGKEDAPKREGYYFAGTWYTDSNCTQEFSFGAPVTADQTLYAKWQETADKSELNSVLAEASKALIGSYTSASKEALKEKLSAAQSVADRDDVNQTQVNQAKTALQQAIDGLVRTYVITFCWNDAKSTIEEQSVADGSYATALTDAPQWAGYAFAGTWYANKKCTIEFQFDTTRVTGDRTLYATWNEVVDKSVLNDFITEANGKLNGQYTEASKEVLQTHLTAAQEMANKADATQSEVDQARKALKKALNELEALKTSYTVTFNWNYGQAESVTQSVLDGDYASALTKADAPEREGYEFTGKWYTDPSCMHEFMFGETAITGNKTVLYAGWTKGGLSVARHTVTFDWNYPRCKKDMRGVDDGDKATALTKENAPNRAGFQFTGKWYTDPDCKNEYDFETAITGDITLYADWNKTVDPNPGLTQAKAELDASLTQAENADQADYSESGWRALQAAIAKAEEAWDSEDKDAVTAAKKELDAAIAYTKTAETAAEKGQLQELYDQYLEDYNGDWYTEETWKLFQDALNEVKGILEKGNAATLEEITTVNNQLAQAQKGLNTKPGITLWTATFNWNYEGAKEVTRPVVQGGRAKAPGAAPAREGYAFTGKWYTDQGCTTEYDFSKETVTSNLKLYAKWQSNDNGDHKGDQNGEDKAKEEAKKTAETAQASASEVALAGQGDYTEESWRAFMLAYNALKNLTEEQKNSMSASDWNKLAEALKQAQNALVKVKVTLKFASKTYQIANGKSIKLMDELTILPENAAKQKLVWKMTGSSKYARLNSGTGAVKALKAGVKNKVTVTVTTEDGKASAKTTVKIMKGRVTKVAAKGAKKVKVKANKSITLKTKVTVKGGKPVNKALKWTSSNSAVATVKGIGKSAANAKVKIAKNAKKGKKVTITATATDGTGKKVKFTVTVK